MELPTSSWEDAEQQQQQSIRKQVLDSESAGPFLLDFLELREINSRHLQDTTLQRPNWPECWLHRQEKLRDKKIMLLMTPYQF